MTQLSQAALGVTALFLLTQALAVERQTLRDHVQKAAVHPQVVGRLPRSSRLDLAIGLPLRNQEELAALLEGLYDPASPEYRHYLTPQQFAERFGPTQEDYESVKFWAESQGLVVTGTHPNRTLLDINGSVADIERTLHVTMQVYQHPIEARTFHAPDVEPSVDLAPRLLHIGGLNNFHIPRPLARRSPLGASRNRRSLGGSAPGGSFMGKDFRAAYVPGVALTGAGQSVALLAIGGYYASDITDYETLAGLPGVPLQNVVVGNFAISPDSGNFEVSSDIEMAISMAPGLSQVLIYEGYVDTDVLNRIATDNVARQISSSWVLNFDATQDQIFKQYAAQGQSFFQASGDGGAYPNDWVADDLYITAVGGTELTTSGSGGAWLSETVWNQGYVVVDYGYSASGGGISPTYSIPSWQTSVSMVVNKGSATRRNSPDVAMVAQDVWVRWNKGDSSSAVGTSLSAPLWAGFAALANQLAQENGRPSIGFINPTIYALGKGPSYASLFHDITTGNNTNAVSPSRFFAVSGYDLCTGWGTPNGSNLLYALALPERLQIAPQTNFIASGPVGGPFSPASQTCNLTNSGAASLDWTLGSVVPWLDASPSRGTLAPGDPVTSVTLSINAAANNLAAGSYAGNVWFTNLADSTVQSRAVTLTVFTAPQIISNLVDQAVLEGATATFTVVVSPISGPAFYEWTRDGVALTDDGHVSGSTTSTLTIDNVSATDVGLYEVTVTNSLHGSTSQARLLMVASPPLILTAPGNQTVLPGATATFAVKAVGTLPLTYQWQAHGTIITNGGNDTILTVHNVTPADAGTYSVIVSNALGVATNSSGVLTLIPLTAPGVTLVMLHSFSGSDGANPLSALIQARDGRLYGTTTAGGASGQGTVFRVTTNGVFSTLHSFSGGNDGGAPLSGLVEAADGNLYGTTPGGGRYGLGTIFRITTNGALTTARSFDGTNDGQYVYAGLLQAADGNLYGTAGGDSTTGNGTVFRLTPGGAFTLLHLFDGLDGASPFSGVIQGADGDFYGVTRSGGAHQDGTLFKMTAAATLTTLFDFHGVEPNPARPETALIQASDGNFYGACGIGGVAQHGAVYRITPTGQLTTLYSFTGGRDGRFPLCGLLEAKGGYFYGTTSYGGAGFDGTLSVGQGTVFRMTPNGELNTIAYFVGPNGANPASRQVALMQGADGCFYGTTYNGGAQNDGIVFRLVVPEPTLTIALSGSQTVLSWPAWASDLGLQQTSELTASTWTAVTNAPVVTNLQNQIVLTASPSGNTFYRLTR